MTRRSSPDKLRADRTYPIVAHFRVPVEGLALAGIDPHGWLMRHLGAGRHAIYSAGRPGRDVFSVYFRQLGDLVAFVEAHQVLELADEVSG